MIKNMCCKEGMREMADNSVDSIVTDPPYSIGFMGKKWDKSGIAHDVEMWAECLRVLKPGGYLLAFSASRTYHRMTVAIEDAGFDIRDSIFWVYSTGFPKSYNLDRERGKSICGCESNEKTEYDERRNETSATSAEGKQQNTKHNMRQVHEANLQKEINDCEKQEKVLWAHVREPSIREFSSSHSGVSKEEIIENDRGTESCLEGRGNAIQEERKLQEYTIHPGTNQDDIHGKEGRLHNGTQDGDGSMVQNAINKDGSSSPHRSRSSEQRQEESGVMAGQQKPQVSGTWEICGRCDKPILPSGLGTALKPAHEPICVARKPLSESTVAANVLLHGTGAVNIDGCRVGGESTVRVSGSASIGYHGGTSSKGISFGSNSGRWPANFIHDGLEEEWSRYFYCAKASKADRDEGLHEFEKVVTNDGRQIPADNAYQRGKTERHNNHPTVKPTELMRYLCRLVTPPGGLILDPFAGSGSTGKAAIKEGFHFVGFEKEAQYCSLANARMSAAASSFSELV